MNEKEEFESIVSEQKRLQHSLDALGQRITALEPQFRETEITATASPGENQQIEQTAALPEAVPPPLPSFSSGTDAQIRSVIPLPPENDTVREPEPSAPPLEQPFELRVGTYWLVRIGIVLLLGNSVSSVEPCLFLNGSSGMAYASDKYEPRAGLMLISPGDDVAESLVASDPARSSAKSESGREPNRRDVCSDSCGVA